MSTTEELRFRWLIDGEDKYLIREDGSRIGPTDATDCEIELWKARQAAYSQGYKDALTAAVEVCESFVKDISGVPEFRDQALAVQHRADVIKALPIPEAQK